jgi:hypothetical protein
MSRKSFLLRIDQKLYEELEAWAQQEMRSVNGQMEYLLKQSVFRYKGTSQTAPDHAKQQSESGKPDKQDLT